MFKTLKLFLQEPVASQPANLPSAQAVAGADAAQVDAVYRQVMMRMGSGGNALILSKRTLGVVVQTNLQAAGGVLSFRGSCALSSQAQHRSERSNHNL